MAYSDFTVGKVKQAFGIQTIEGKPFFTAIVPVAPSSTLVEVLDETLPKHQISLFSGQDFTVDANLGLSGICDFLISKSPEQLEIESPVVVLVEAKKADINSGMGQRKKA